ncbi:MAG: peptide-methionine (R)-S-oxide reductase MsrB [Planctomycetaceae bacterium]|nr:peptide-methionine (R)-S-oxide reductase MsrB [Planctomycetaceae bacterium]
MSKLVFVCCGFVVMTMNFNSEYSYSRSAVAGGSEKQSPESTPKPSASADEEIVEETPPPWENLSKPADAKLRHILNATQYNVTQRQGTEPAFRNRYWKNHAAGIYVDIVSGEPLFSSDDKYDSGTGWPSFVKPIDEQFIEYREDSGFFTSRTEVRSKLADSHLGHVFNDGPATRGGKRYCMNSAALRFIPRARMEAEGYGKYLPEVQEK